MIAENTILVSSLISKSEPRGSNRRVRSKRGWNRVIVYVESDGNESRENWVSMHNLTDERLLFKEKNNFFLHHSMVARYFFRHSRLSFLFPRRNVPMGNDMAWSCVHDLCYERKPTDEQSLGSFVDVTEGLLFIFPTESHTILQPSRKRLTHAAFEKETHILPLVTLLMQMGCRVLTVLFFCWRTSWSGQHFFFGSRTWEQLNELLVTRQLISSRID